MVSFCHFSYYLIFLLKFVLILSYHQLQIFDLITQNFHIFIYILLVLFGN